MSRPKLKATARQLEVVKLMVSGMHPKRIAAELGCSRVQSETVQ